MKLRNVVTGTLGVLAIQSALGQVPVGPTGIAWTATESFEALSSSSEYLHFGGFGGTATFQRYGGGWMRATSSAYSGSQGMFLDQTDLTIGFASPKRTFGGYFLSVDSATTGMYVSFYRGSRLVGVTVLTSLSTSRWSWRGWDLTALGGFDRVRIVGNGGFAGMINVEALRVR